MKRNLLTLLIILLSVIYGGNNLSAQVAKVGNKEYANIADAIAAWEGSASESTMTLLADVTLPRTITLKSTVHHILNLGTYTMTAASEQNAIVIKACGTGSSERYAITIKADATNPGGIDAGSKSIVYYNYADGGIDVNDRPIIKIEGGIFKGDTTFNSVWAPSSGGFYTIGAAARKCATITITGGIFNCSIVGSGKSKLIISGGTFNYGIYSQGDSTATRLISGGKFKSSISGTMDSNNTKFWIGTSMANSNVGVYVNEDLYLVIGGPVITDYSEDYPCSTTYNSYSTWSTPLKYSSANPSAPNNTNPNGLYWSSIKLALDKNNSSSKTVNIHTDTLDLRAATTKYTYNGTIKLPKEDSEFTVIYKTEPTLNVQSGINGISVATKDFENVPSTGLTTRVYSLCPDLDDNGECPHVARINGNHYATLSAAYTAAKDNDVINILKNFEEEGLVIDKNVTIDFNNFKYTATSTATSALTVAEGKTITLKNGTITSSAPYVISTSGNLTIQDMTITGTVEYLGGEMFTDKSFNVSAKKYFKGVGTDHTQNWSTISTPIANAAIPTAGTHDLYRFNENKQLWEYYKKGNGEGNVSNPFSTLELGRGYLYANAENITFELTGDLNTEEVVFHLSYTPGNSLAGFNMIGNPFTYSIDNGNMSPTVELAGSEDSGISFYVVGDGGTWEAKIDGKIAPMESVLIQAKGEEEEGEGGILTMSPANTGSKRAARNENSYLTINVASKTHSDVAYVSFNDGMGLDKINHRNPDNPMIYIPVEGKNYAIAMMDKDVKEVPVYFNANRMAEYTISIEQKNCEFSSVVLVDKLTGVETNLLIEDYSFMARSFDNADRFIIRLSIEDNDDSETDNFAYVSNGSIVIEKIEGNANIRIFDIMGRHIMGTNATGNANIPVETMSTGMYIIQMSDDNGVKVQKIIID